MEGKTAPTGDTASHHGNDRKRKPEIHKEMKDLHECRRSNETAGVKTGKLIIKSEGRSYAKLMEAVEDEVNLDATDIAVEAIRTTNGGDLLVRGPRQGGKSEVAEAQSENN
ncbi:hypothetical protein JTB14_017265 [Gonioctena quinquepunctata]|nr:hypothetical protein JTB14_017265 [Gonioctena quinquepunctata]